MAVPGSSTSLETITAARDPGRARRIVGVDLARGVALLGMAATHMLAVQDRSGDLTPVGWLFAGRASALFAVLAGVSLALVTGGRNPVVGRDRARARVTIAVRATLIGLFGLALAGLGSPVAVILAYYAVLFVLALPFLGLRAQTLVPIAAAWAVLSPVLSHLLRQGDLPRTGVQVSFVPILENPLAAALELLLTGYYPALTWLTYVLAGLAVGRLDLRAVRTAWTLAVTGAGLAVAAWAGSALLLAGGAAESLFDQEPGGGATWWHLLSSEANGTTPRGTWSALLLAVPHSGTAFDLVGTTGSALAVLGVCLLLVRIDVVRVLTHPVAAAGSMTLTLYTAHVVVLAQRWVEFDTAAYYLAHVAVALVFATLWLAVLRRGPLEAVVHLISSRVGALVVPPAHVSPAGASAEVPRATPPW